METTSGDKRDFRVFLTFHVDSVNFVTVGCVKLFFYYKYITNYKEQRTLYRENYYTKKPKKKSEISFD